MQNASTGFLSSSSARGQSNRLPNNRPPEYLSSGVTESLLPTRITTQFTISHSSTSILLTMDHPASRTQPADSIDNTPAELGFSFAGGGWLMCYLFGVAKALHRHGLHSSARFTGTSAGALAAIGLTLDADFDAITHTVISSYVPEAHGSIGGPFRMRRYLTDALTRLANLDAFEKCNEDPLKCTVVYTSLSAIEPRRKSTFTSANHLLETLIASCCATPLVGMPFRFEGEWVIDGGLTENQPRFQEYHSVQRIVNVSPNVWDTTADIRPSQYVPPWWSMFPPSPQELEWVFTLGQRDGHDWCLSNGCSQSGVAPVEIPLRPHVEHTALAHFVGYHRIERALQSQMKGFTLTSEWTTSAAMRFFADLLVWELVQAATVASGTLWLWMLVAVASALTASVHRDNTGLAVYFSLCGCWAVRAYRCVQQSSETIQIEHSVDIMRGLRSLWKGTTTFQRTSAARSSLLYQIPTAHIHRKTSGEYTMN
jgi:predicted acylesterase/phospholipase RssA